MAAYTFAPNLDDADVLVDELRAILEKLCERVDRLGRPKRTGGGIGPFGVLSILLSDVRLVLQFRDRERGVGGRSFGGGRTRGGGGGASF